MFRHSVRELGRTPGACWVPGTPGNALRPPGAVPQPQAPDSGPRTAACSGGTAGRAQCTWLRPEGAVQLTAQCGKGPRLLLTDTAALVRSAGRKWPCGKPLRGGGRAAPGVPQRRLLVLQQDPRGDWSVPPPPCARTPGRQAGSPPAQSSVWDAERADLETAPSHLPASLHTVHCERTGKSAREQAAAWTGTTGAGQRARPTGSSALGTAPRLAAPVLWDLQ